MFNYNDGTEYPAMVGTCLGMQVLVFIIMLLVGSQGFKTSLWCVREKRELRAAVELSEEAAVSSTSTRGTFPETTELRDEAELNQTPRVRDSTTQTDTRESRQDIDEG